jgi:hypothetical protein
MTLIVCVCQPPTPTYAVVQVKKRLQPESTSYTVRVEGRFVVCELKQNYKLDQEVTRATYMFPLDFNSSLCDLKVITPRETIHANIQEKKKARDAFEKAKEEGKQVFMASSVPTEPDLYSFEFANILKGDTLEVVFTYVSEVSFGVVSSNEQSQSLNTVTPTTQSLIQCVFYIPTFVSPRYGSSYDIQCPSHELNISIRLGSVAKDIIISGMRFNISTNKDHWMITHKSKEFIEKDVEIKYNMPVSNEVSLFNYVTPMGQNYTLMLGQIMPKINFVTKKIDIVLVIDRSGSMSGNRMKAAKLGLMTSLYELQTMKQKDSTLDMKFCIVGFGSTYKVWNGTSSGDESSEGNYPSDLSKAELFEVNKTNIENALKFCGKIDADLGGTESYNALNAARSISSNCVFITDGDTGNNNKLHQLCKTFTTLCVLGIGSGINRNNINEIARNGNGISLFAGDDEDPTDRIVELMRLCFVPTIHDVKILVSPPKKNTNLVSFIDGDMVMAESPSDLAIDFVHTHNPIANERFYTFYGLSTNQIHGDITLNAVFKDTKFVSSFVPNVSNDQFIITQNVAKMIAKRVVQHCSNELNDEKKLKISLDFNIVSDLTALIAIGNEKVDLEKIKEVEPEPEMFYQKSTIYTFSKTAYRSSSCFERGQQLSGSAPSRSLEGSRGATKGSSDGFFSNIFSSALDSISSAFTFSSISERESVFSNDFKQESTSIKKKVVESHVEAAMKKIKFNELMEKYFNEDLALFKPNVLTYIKCSYSIYDPILINLYMLYLIYICYSKADYNSVLTKMKNKNSINNETIGEFLNFISTKGDPNDYLVKKLNL